MQRVLRKCASVCIPTRPAPSRPLPGSRRGPMAARCTRHSGRLCQVGRIGQKTIKYYVCAAHLLCTVKVCVRQGGAWGVYADADRSHATDNNYMTRTNAALTYSQETEVKHAIEYYGASPGQLLHAAQGIALGNGASELDEKGVEGTCCTCQPALAVCTAPRRHPHSTRAAQLVGRFACAFRCALLCRRETSSRTRGPRYHPEVQLSMGQPTGTGRQKDR